MATALNNLANVHLARREPEAALESAQQQLEVSTKFDLAAHGGGGPFNIGWALAQQGELAEGVRDMREAVEAVEATGADKAPSIGIHGDIVSAFNFVVHLAGVNDDCPTNIRLGCER